MHRFLPAVLILTIGFTLAPGSVFLPPSLAYAETHSFTSNLTVGSRGADVTLLQQFLVSKGYLQMPAGVAYGYFGPLTRGAVAQWQAANGISPAVGYFGPISRGRMAIEPSTGGTVKPAISDRTMRALPETGLYAYKNWNPGNPNFVSLGQSFIDPVFGSTVRRLTNDFQRQSESDIYSKNGFWNADGTRMFHNTADSNTIINTTTGAVVRSNVPGNFDGSFDPVNPNIWYWFDNNKLEQYDITTGKSSTLKTFAARLGPLGGSVDWIDRTGRYMVLNIGGSIRVWDKKSDILYSGSLPGEFNGGWAGISPDGEYLVTQDQVYQSYKINHAAKSLPTTGTMFWNLCGGHGDLVSTGGGGNYLITFECHSEAAVYRVDITLAQSMNNLEKQRSDNVSLIDTDWKDDGHFSCASGGLNQDWCFISLESTDNNFGNIGAWRPYKDEIVMVQMVAPFTIRRLAHHRSQSTDENYFHQPRVNANWSGDMVVWASNFGYDKIGYSDIYGIEVK